MAQPKWLRSIEATLLGVAIASMEANRASALAEIEAVAGSASGSASQKNVNAALEKIVPAFLRPIVDVELAQAEGVGAAQVQAGAPAYFDAVIAALKSAQAKLAA